MRVTKEEFTGLLNKTKEFKGTDKNSKRNCREKSGSYYRKIGRS